MVKRNLGLEWGLKYLSQHQNILLEERTQLINNPEQLILNPKLLVLNRKALVKNWESWQEVQIKLSSYQWWIHTHERVLLDARLKLMKTQEVLEKYTRDIMFNDNQARKIVEDLLAELDYEDWINQLKQKKKNPKNLREILYVSWCLWRNDKSFFERQQMKLLAERQSLIITQQRLLKRIYKATHSEHQLAIKQEWNAKTLNISVWWEGWYTNWHHKELNSEYWKFMDLKRLLWWPERYWELLDVLKGYEWEFSDYKYFFWWNRERFQDIQSRLTKARLNGQYYIQLLKENQILLMKNQAKLMNLQDNFFKTKEKILRNVQTYARKLPRYDRRWYWNYKGWKNIKPAVKSLSWDYAHKIKIFPYTIKFAFLTKTELPFLSSTPFPYHYYNGITSPHVTDQFFFISFRIPYLFLSHVGFMCRVSNFNPDYSFGPWWKWRTPYQVFYDSSFQNPIRSVRELIWGSEHTKAYNRWPKHYTADKQFSKDIWSYNYYSFGKDFDEKLEDYLNTYYTNWVGDPLTHPAVCDFSKDFGTYYYHFTDLKSPIYNPSKTHTDIISDNSTLFFKSYSEASSTNTKNPVNNFVFDLFQEKLKKNCVNSNLKAYSQNMKTFKKFSKWQEVNDVLKHSSSIEEFYNIFNEFSENITILEKNNFFNQIRDIDIELEYKQKFIQTKIQKKITQKHTLFTSKLIVIRHKNLNFHKNNYTECL